MGVVGLGGNAQRRPVLAVILKETVCSRLLHRAGGHSEHGARSDSSMHAMQRTGPVRAGLQSPRQPGVPGPAEEHRSWVLWV